MLLHSDKPTPKPHRSHKLQVIQLEPGRLAHARSDPLEGPRSPLNHPRHGAQVEDGPVDQGGAQLVDPLDAGVVEEILDLLMYVESAGNKDHPAFKKE